MPRSRRRSRSRSSSKSGSYSSSRSRRSRKKAEKKRSRSRSNRHKRRSRSRSDRRRSRSRRGSRKRSRSRSRRSRKRSRSKEKDKKKTASKKESRKSASPKKEDVAPKKTKLPVRALANALSVVKKDAKAAEQERREAEKNRAAKERETNAQRRTRTGIDDAGKDSERAMWGPDKSESKGRKGKGKEKGRGWREAKGEALERDVPEDPAEIERRQKRAARFGGKAEAEAKPAAPAPADIPLPAAQQESQDVKPPEKVAREEGSKKKPVSRGLRAWSDDEGVDAKDSDGKLERVDDASEGLRACAHPYCTLAKHSDSSVSERFCCKACAACFESDASCAPWNHGKKCEQRQMTSKK